MESALVRTWRTNCALHLALLDAIPASALSHRYTPTTRTVAAQFAHVHNVRVYQLKQRGPKHLGRLSGFERRAQPSKSELKSALRASENAVAAMLAEFVARGKVKSWPGPPESFLGYLISHEAHHRGLTMVCLRMGGTKVPDKVHYTLWEGWRKLSSA